MNANKHLDFYNPDSIYYGNSRHYIQQLENKVRQQQAEIEALRKSHIELEKGIVKDLNQRQSAEPVAWTACLDCGQRVTGDSIHTCSPQLKQLTDEEIDDFTVRIYNCRTGAEAHEIVLAILKKASEI